MRKLLFLCAIATLVAAWSSDSDNAVGPDPKSCTNGSIALGDTKTGTLDASSCTTFD